MAITEEELILVKKVKFKPTHPVKRIRMPKDVPLIDVEKLVPYKNNAKIHTPQQINKICQSIGKACQWTQPIITDGNLEIIAGHGRRLAAIAYGFQQVPVLVLDGISEEDARLLRLADNKVAEGEVDTNLLEEELRILAEYNVDMLGIFDERELNFLTEDLGEIDFGQISDDLSRDVSEQLEHNDRMMEDIDERNQRLASIFGTRSIRPSEAKILSTFLAHIEEEQGEEGVDALVGFAEIYIEGKDG